MVRTETVELTTVKAVAYRQKLKSGGSGVVIIREDSSQPGIASISKTSGEAIISKNTPLKLFTEDMFSEAIRLTNGMPYKKRSAPKVVFSAEETEEMLGESEAEVVVESKDYEKIVDRYTNKEGKLSYELLNKDLIKLAHSSTRVKKMVEENASLEDIRTYVAGARFREITQNHLMSDEQVMKIAELLDEAYAKGVFREFNKELRKIVR